MRSAVAISILVVAATLAAATVFPGWLGRHGLIVLMTGFLVGLPHGAMDHLAPFWSGRLRHGRRALGLVLAGYLVVAVLTWVLLRLTGPAALPVLLILSVVHFGTGDVMAEPDRLRSAVQDWPSCSRALTVGAEVVARGAPVVVGPLLAWPAQTDRALAAVSVGFHAPPSALRWGLAGLVWGCALLTALVGLRRRRVRPAAEVALLNDLFLLAPPLVAFGVYFGGWHGLRHTARLLSTDPRNRDDLRRGTLSVPLLRFLRSATVPTLTALAGVTGLLLLAQQQEGYLGPVFTGLFALTIPHLVVVALMDADTLQHPGVRQPE